MAGFKEWAVYSRYYNPSRPSQSKLFILRKLLTYESVDGATYQVPKDYISDLGSVPRLLWFILPRDEFPSAYFLHDDLVDRGPWFSRLDADKLLREALILSNAPKWKVKFIYIGVRIGAFYDWLTKY